MKYWYLSAVLLLCNTLLAQSPIAEKSCHIRFQVSDYQTGEGLPMAAIWIKKAEKGLVTDIQGKASFDYSCPLTDTLQVHFMGYTTFQAPIAIQSDTLIKIALQAEETLLEEVQVVGHQHLTSMKTLSVSRIEAKTLELNQGSGLGQSLEQISGVSTLKTGNNIAKPMIHGLHSNRILILNNGVKQEGQQWGAEHAPEIDVFTAEQLSVIKGAATVKYGSEALGGVVLINPPKLPSSGKIGGSLHLIGATNGQMGAVNASLEGSKKNWEGFGWRVQTSTKRGGDMRAPNYWLTNTGVKEFGGSAALGWNKEKWGIETYYSYYQNTIGLLKATTVLGSLEDWGQALSSKTPALTEDSFSYGILLPRQEVKHHLLKLTGYFKFNNSKLEWTYGGQIDHRQEFDRRLGATLSKRPVINLELNSHALDLSWTEWQLGAWKGTVGINLASKDNNNIPGTGRLPLIPNYNSTEAGFFLVEQATFNRWEVEFGIRYDIKNYSVRGRDYRNDLFKDEVFLQNLTATVGASYQINKASTIHTNLGSAWRAPHVAELYSFGRNQATASYEYGLLIGEGNEIEDWDADTTPNEQGLKWVATYEITKSRWNFAATGYLNWIQNYIYQKPQGMTSGVSGVSPLYRYEQTDAMFQGIDMTSKYQLGKRWDWEANASLLWAQDLNTDDELPFMPANSLGNTISYTIPAWKQWKEIYFTLGYDYTLSPTQAPSRVITTEEFIEAFQQDIDLLEADPSNFNFAALPEAYGLWNLSIGAARHWESGKLMRIGVQANNLLNIQYRNYMNRLRNFADEAGRNITFSIKFIF